jgi:hypothetical protein
VDKLLSNYLAIKLILDDDTFEDNNNTKIYLGSSANNDNKVYPRIDAIVDKSMGFSLSNAKVTLYNVTQDTINKFSRVNYSTITRHFSNTIEVYAGNILNSFNLPALIYRGQVSLAVPDYNQHNDVVFTITSTYGINEQNNIIDPTIYSGTTRLDDVIRTLVSKIPNAIYKPKNVFDVIVSPKYEGSAINQIRMLCSDYGYNVLFDKNIVYVVKQGILFSDNIITIGHDDDNVIMFGYPKFETYGRIVRIKYSPEIQFGQKVILRSNKDVHIDNLGSSMQVIEEWYINGLKCNLSTNGPFEMELTLNQIKYTA